MLRVHEKFDATLGQGQEEDEISFSFVSLLAGRVVAVLFSLGKVVKNSLFWQKKKKCGFAFWTQWHSFWYWCVAWKAFAKKKCCKFWHVNRKLTIIVCILCVLYLFCSKLFCPRQQHQSLVTRRRKEALRIACESIKNCWKVISSAKTTFFHIQWKEKKKVVQKIVDFSKWRWTRRLRVSHSALKIKNINSFSRMCLCGWKVCGALCGIYGARPCERKCSNKLSSWTLPLLNQLQLPPAHTLAPAASFVSITYHNDNTHFSYSIYCSLCSLATRKREGNEGQNSYLHSVSLRCHWIDWSDAIVHKRIVFSLCFFMCEVALKE